MNCKTSGERNASDSVTKEKIDELLRFLPSFEKPNRKFVEKWEGDDENGFSIIPYPVYFDDVEQFFRLAAQPFWSDKGYLKKKPGKMLKDSKNIENANLDEIKTMLTYFVRAERFCDGFWEGVLLSGKVIALLKRLKKLRDQENF
jgi:hypothetical protein